MMNLNRRQILAGMGGLAAAGIAGAPARAQQKTLIVPTLGGAWEQFWRAELAPAFTKKSGAAVTLDAGNGRVWSANLRAAGVQKPPYSILMTNEAFASSLRKEGFFEKLDLTKLPNYADLYPLAKKTDGWGAVAMVSPIGLAPTWSRCRPRAGRISGRTRSSRAASGSTTSQTPPERWS
jgi:putative spermidine/putrescine transport system substrate-binding protein